MHFKGLDLNLLVALDVLLTERSITRAGERMHLSQSAMSSALGRLREYFGDELLVQTGRTMRPTPLAERLAVGVREVLLQVETTIRTQPDFDPSNSTRHFRLLMSDYVSTVLLARLLPRLQREAPGITLEVLPVSESPVAVLERGEVDFLVLPSQYLRVGPQSQVLLEDVFCCAAWAGTVRTPALDEWFLGSLGHQRRIEVVAPDFGSLPRLVVGTQRIATVPRRLLRYYARYLPLREWPLPVAMPPMCEVLAWHGLRDRDPAAVWLREAMTQEMACADDGEEAS
jgi:DNA-binding transcriptional LysR family regulator